MNGKKALIVGIDDYPDAPLFGCVNDAISISSELERHGTGSVNFGVNLVSSNNCAVLAGDLRKQITQLFCGGPASVALFYFAGHGSIIGDEAYLCTMDGVSHAPGIPLSEVVNIANNADGEVHNRVILLDCCFAGGAGNLSIVNKQISALGKGVTIMTACRDNETAQEMNGHGLFTYLVLDALRGGASDILGRITPASVYSHIDQSLGDWDQRPLYKSHVDNFLVLKEMSPKVSLKTLRRLPFFFKSPSSEYSLTPDHEHTNQDGTSRTDGDNVMQGEFRELQDCNRVGLVEPVSSQDMYWAAIKSKSCRLTALGSHYYRLATDNRI
tara:strand:+ start:4258 stop:5238 length:981 start_codon:yes stop_codon:yes gene_type:complete